jgi:hypothetical protein
MPESVPALKPAAKKDLSRELVIGEEGFSGLYLAYPWLIPGLVNKSSDRVIKGFELTYYCTDGLDKTIYRKDTKEQYYTQQYEMTLGPGQSAFPVYAWLYGYQKAKSAYVAVTGITFSDGTIVEIPKSKWDFYGWEI